MNKYSAMKKRPKGRWKDILIYLFEVWPKHSYREVQTVFRTPFGGEITQLQR